MSDFLFTFVYKYDFLYPFIVSVSFNEFLSRSLDLSVKL